MSTAGGWLREELQLVRLPSGIGSSMAGLTTTARVLIDHGVIANLERFTTLAPLHQPHNLAPIRTLLANNNT